LLRAPWKRMDKPLFMFARDSPASNQLPISMFFRSSSWLFSRRTFSWIGTSKNFLLFTFSLQLLNDFDQIVTFTTITNGKLIQLGYLKLHRANLSLDVHPKNPLLKVFILMSQCCYKKGEGFGVRRNRFRFNKLTSQFLAEVLEVSSKLAIPTHCESTLFRAPAS